ncbi:hypothetical protein CEXT_116031 [Caerostris extrusa]|uniref:Uncharacterized protein n=1 Tax=Caerostris extrusa TaxID=172846 RepID=A0AAV4YFT1_CAEEX|nr:hypothetical protein CEXT_116031 [Caerostris extrusa]
MKIWVLVASDGEMRSVGEYQLGISNPTNGEAGIHSGVKKSLRIANENITEFFPLLKDWVSSTGKSVLVVQGLSFLKKWG